MSDLSLNRLTSRSFRKHRTHRQQAQHTHETANRPEGHGLVLLHDLEILDTMPRGHSSQHLMSGGPPVARTPYHEALIVTSSSDSLVQLWHLEEDEDTGSEIK